jgi:hypothetical protein
MATITAKLTDRALQHPLITLSIAAVLGLVLLVGGIYFGGAILTGIREAFEDRKVDQLQKKADGAVEQSNAERTAADADAGERKTEDAVRERTIKPEIQRTSRKVDEARARTRRAQTDYENVQKPNLDHDPDTRALHQRNCSDLRDLYPREPLPFCER